MNSPATKQKRSRLTRKKNAAPLQLNERDLLVFRLLHHHRILRTRHIMALTGMSRGVANRRLELLFDNRYVSRVDPKKETNYELNSDMLYCLAPEGAKQLLERNEFARPHSDPRTKAGRDHVSHALLISDFLVAVESACLDDESVRFISSEEILAGSVRLMSTRPLEIESKIKTKEGAWKPHKIAADGLFGLHLQGDSRPRYFFFEADRGTMPTARKKSPDQTQLRTKYQTYYEYRRAKLVAKEFGFEMFAVLFLTDAADARVMSARAAADTIKKNNRSWFFATNKILQTPGGILTEPWLRGDGSSVYLSQPAIRPGQ